MTRKLFISFAIFAVSVLSAKTYNVKLIDPVTVSDTLLQPGEYKLELNDANMTITNGKQTVKTEVKVENSDRKFSNTSVRLKNTDGKPTVSEIRLGGTTTRLVLN